MIIAIVHNDNLPPIKLDLHPSTEIATLKSLLEVELNINPMRQKLTLLHRAALDLTDGQTLASLGVEQHDVFLLEDKQTPSDPNDLIASQAHEMIQSLSNDPARLKRLEGSQPALAQAILANDIPTVAKRIQAHSRSINEYSPSTQQLLLDNIRNEQIEQNMATAFEILPETFGNSNSIIPFLQAML